MSPVGIVLSNAIRNPAYHADSEQAYKYGGIYSKDVQYPDGIPQSKVDSHWTPWHFSYKLLAPFLQQFSAQETILTRTGALRELKRTDPTGPGCSWKRTSDTAKNRQRPTLGIKRTDVGT